MDLVSIFSFFTSIALLIPIVFIVMFRFSLRKTFPALLVYYAVTLAYTLMTNNFFTVGQTVKHYTGITNNILDGPLMLAFLTYLAYSAKQLKILQILVAGQIVFTVIVVLFSGYTINAIRIVLGPGLLMVLITAICFFSYYISASIRKPDSATGKTLISASLIFSYGTYFVIYLIYYVLKRKVSEDSYLIYFLSTFLSSICMSFGIFYEAKRVKKIKEEQVMRKELADLYKEEKKDPNKRSKNPQDDDFFGFNPSEVIPGFRN